MESTYSTSSLPGLVSSKRRLHNPVFRGHAEIEADGLGMADMEIAVGFRRKAGVHAAAVFPGLDVGLDYGADEILPRGKIFNCHIDLAS